MNEHGESITQKDGARQKGDDNDLMESRDKRSHDETYLSEHCVSMRAACRHCLSLFQDIEPRLDDLRIVLENADMAKAQRLSSEHERNREEACREFWSAACSDADGCVPSIPEFHFQTGTTKLEEEQQQQVFTFQQEFHNRNLPCLVTGLERRHFSFVHENWRSQHNESEETIKRQWFLETLGSDCQVPLRYNENSSHLDKDGRADECKTRNVTMKEWIQMLQDIQSGEKCSNGCSKPTYYLKDWHLQQILEEERNQTSNPVDNPPCLYSCPSIFQHDLLNSFLRKFTKGDYRFCYWGPAKSSTLRHSDVLHSFSWSYNVQGTKEWTFFSPFDDGDDTSFQVIQRTGQAMFVPATWQHQVVNLEETISINHNWITTANLDLTWECLRTEMAAIRDELSKWQGNGSNSNMEQDLEACENMLRGCVGLDVSSFFFMTLVRLLEVTKNLMDLHGRGDIGTTHERTAQFDTFRLVEVLKRVMGSDQDLVQLQGRLCAVLQSNTLAADAESTVKSLIDWVESLQ
ncbi:MAG: hypothetical protein SGILL_007723 [Bacillariaceae sp.]